MFEKLTRERFDLILDPYDYSPEKLLGELKKDSFLAEELLAYTVPSAGLTCEMHSIMALKQYDKYFCKMSDKLPAVISQDLFRIVLALHDIGKPRAISEGEKSRQHIYTVPILEDVLFHLEYDKTAIRACAGLLSGDPLGSFLKNGGKDIGEAAKKITEMSQAAGIDKNDFYDLMLVYYQVDAGAYTSDAGWNGVLDHLFIFEPEKKRMSLAKDINILVAKLRSQL